MPNLITTRMRIAGLGKPRINIIGGDFDGPEVVRREFVVLIHWLMRYFSYDKRNRLIIVRPKGGIQ